MASSKRAVGFVAILGALAWAGAAHAESQVEQARAHFQAGERAYRDARYLEALHEFEAGYALSPRPEFLLNFAQTDRKLGRTDEAIEQCRRFLAAAPESPLAPEARRLLEALNEERVFGTAPRPAPSAPVVEPKTSPPAAGRVDLTVKPEHHPPAAKRSRVGLWITLGIAGGIVIVTGLAVGLAVGLSTRDNYPSAPLVVSFGR